MTQKNIILSSLKESLFLMWRNKPLFILLFILQIAFFAVFSYINFTYQTRILADAQEISDYLSKLKLDEATFSSNILERKDVLGDDPLLISRNFSEISGNFRFYLFYIFLSLVAFISIAWTATARMVHTLNLKSLAGIILKEFCVLIFYLGLIFLFFYSLINVSLIELASVSSKLLTKYIPFLAISIILAYFMFVSLSLVPRAGLQEIVQKTLRIGIKKAHYILAAYSINIFILLISMSLFYYFIEKNLFILLLSFLLAVFSFIFGRLLLIKVVGKLD